ncbi:peroxidase 12-like protein [Tanacetum coccineum]
MASKMTLFASVFLVVMLMHLQILEAQKPPLVKGLSWNYYQSSCPKLESIIKKQLEKVFKKDVGLAAALLRMHFHDCFVQGCETVPVVHKECGAGSVSCADITAVVARDSIVLTGGPTYSVTLGRRDGLSFATRDATLANLPSPFVPTDTLLTTLAAKNFDATDAVALSGAHTIGVAHCSSFTRRLYPTQDTTLDKTFATTLKGVCPAANTNASTFMDLRSPNVFDNKYFVDLMNKQGLLTSDQDLYTNKKTRDIVTSFAVNQTLFFEKFVNVMSKMGGK